MNSYLWANHINEHTLKCHRIFTNSCLSMLEFLQSNESMILGMKKWKVFQNRHGQPVNRDNSYNLLLLRMMAVNPKNTVLQQRLDYNELCWVEYDIKCWESPSPLKKFIIMCPQDSEPFVIHACHLKFSRYFLPFFWIKFLIDVQRFKFHHAVLRQFDDDPLRFNFSPELCK